MIKEYKQTTYETCLVCTLLQAVNELKPIKINQETELEVVNHSMKFSKDDFIVGHLDYIAKKFNVNILRIVDNKLFLNYINKLETPKGVKNKVEKINLKLINELLKNNQLILYIDSYSLFEVNHYPHFITVLEKENNNYKIFDTWDGRIKVIESKILSKSISSLRNHLKFCPQIILIEN